MKALWVLLAECKLALLHKGEAQIQEQYLDGSMVRSKMEASVKNKLWNAKHACLQKAKRNYLGSIESYIVFFLLGSFKLPE